MAESLHIKAFIVTYKLQPGYNIVEYVKIFSGPGMRYVQPVR